MGAQNRITALKEVTQNTPSNSD